MSDVFISFAHQDVSMAHLLARKLQEQGLSVFFDQSTLVSGDSFKKSILEKIKIAQVVVVLLSNNSKRSRWVEHELQTVLENNSNVIPVLLDSSATENWVWPLISNRNAIKYKSGDDISIITDNILKTIKNNELLMREKKLAIKEKMLTIKEEILESKEKALIDCNMKQDLIDEEHLKLFCKAQSRQQQEIEKSSSSFFSWLLPILTAIFGIIVGVIIMWLIKT